jgi:hypothetical protein
VFHFRAPRGRSLDAFSTFLMSVWNLTLSTGWKATAGVYAIFVEVWQEIKVAVADLE